MKRALEQAEKFDDELRTYDFLGSSFVIVRGKHDRSQLVYSEAFTRAWTDPETQDKWLMVFTEHYGFHVFNAEDHKVLQLKSEEIPDISVPRNQAAEPFKKLETFDSISISKELMGGFPCTEHIAIGVILEMFAAGKRIENISESQNIPIKELRFLLQDLGRFFNQNWDREFGL